MTMCEVIKMDNLEEFEYDEDGVKDFYESFESSLENDEISAAEDGFMVGFADFDD